ncbi:MAG: hypothetical protein Q9170_000636 [Blastenia crenularia]
MHSLYFYSLIFITAVLAAATPAPNRMPLPMKRNAMDTAAANVTMAANATTAANATGADQGMGKGMGMAKGMGNKKQGKDKKKTAKVYDMNGNIVTVIIIA